MNITPNRVKWFFALVDDVTLFLERRAAEYFKLLNMQHTDFAFKEIESTSVTFERYVGCGNYDFESVPSWVFTEPDWEDRANKLHAVRIQKQQEQAERARQEAARRIEERERAQYEKLRQKFEPAAQ